MSHRIFRRLFLARPPGFTRRQQWPRQWLSSAPELPDTKYTPDSQLADDYAVDYDKDLAMSLRSLSEEDGMISLQTFWKAITSTGLRTSDPRFERTRQLLYESAPVNITETIFDDVKVDLQRLIKCTGPSKELVLRSMMNDMIIKNFDHLTAKIDNLYTACLPNSSGQLASYIPMLANADPESWAVSLCTVNGQRYSVGDSDKPFSLQSCFKPLLYAQAVSELGADQVHRWVGQESSGRTFNALMLDQNRMPHNPMINAGAMAVLSLMEPSLPLADRFTQIFDQASAVAGGEYLGLNVPVYLSERETADRNWAIAYYMRENKCFPEDTNLQELLDLYFQMCSVESTTDSGSVIAATLANGGVCPITEERVLTNDAVRNTLSLLYSCGMHDYSGKFSFKVGLPAKSGISGAILLVVPNVMGLCCWSPPVDSYGNSNRGVQFCEEFVRTFNFHNFDSLEHTDGRMDPRR